MSDEKGSYSKFRKNIIIRGDRIDRVENPIVPGMPDVSCKLRRCKEFWIEMKSPSEPLRDSTNLFGSGHPVLTSQINWIQSQNQAGGHVFLFIDTDKRRMLISGKFAEQANRMTVTELENIASWKSIKPSSRQEWLNLRSFFEALD